jgi:hypothetical protein
MSANYANAVRRKRVNFLRQGSCPASNTVIWEASEHDSHSPSRGLGGIALPRSEVTPHSFLMDSHRGPFTVFIAVSSPGVLLSNPPRMPFRIPPRFPHFTEPPRKAQRLVGPPSRVVSLNSKELFRFAGGSASNRKLSPVPAFEGARVPRLASGANFRGTL